MPDDAAARLDMDTLEMAISDTFEERFPGRESGDALDKFCALMDNLQQVKFCGGCIRTEERLCQLHAAYLSGVEYVDAMTTLWLLDQRLGELTGLLETLPTEPEGEAG